MKLLAFTLSIETCRPKVSYRDVLTSRKRNTRRTERVSTRDFTLGPKRRTEVGQPFSHFLKSPLHQHRLHQLQTRFGDLGSTNPSIKGCSVFKSAGPLLYALYLHWSATGDSPHAGSSFPCFAATLSRQLPQNASWRISWDSLRCQLISQISLMRFDSRGRYRMG